MNQHHDGLADSDSPFLQDSTTFQRLIGRLIYLTVLRLNLAYPVHVLAQYMNAPCYVDWHAALKPVRYLAVTATQGLLYSFKANHVLIAFCDADWGSCKATRQSITEYCVTFGGTLISWKCKKQQTVSRSLVGLNITVLLRTRRTWDEFGWML